MIKELIAKGPGKKALTDEEMPEVLYTFEYCNDSGVVFETRESDTPLDPVSLNNAKESNTQESSSCSHQQARKKPVIEIKSRMTLVSCLRNSSSARHRTTSPLGDYDFAEDDGYGYHYEYLDHQKNRYSDTSTTSSTTTTERFQVEKTEMLIHSPHLLSSLAAVVCYYADVDFSSCFPGGKGGEREPVTVDAPYYVLVHHIRELELYKLNQPACHSPEYAAVTAQHIDVLLAYLRRWFGGKLEAEWARWNNPRQGEATATFEMFWMLLKPGEVVYLERNGTLVPYVLGFVCSTGYTNSNSNIATAKGNTNGRAASGGAYMIEFWNVGYYKGYLTRQMESTYIYPWSGERPISSLQVIPARFVGGGGQAARAMAEKQVRLGRLYWELARGPAYKEYDGELLLTRDSSRGGNMTGRVIVDCEGWERYYDGPNSGSSSGGGSGGGGAGWGPGYNCRMLPGHVPPPSRHRRDAGSPMRDYLPQMLSRCSCPECKRTTWTQPAIPSPFAGFEKRDPRQDPPPENEELYFLVIKDTIPAFILGERRWASLRLDCLKEVKPDKDAFKYLVLDPEIKLTVKALIGKFASPNGKVSPWLNDFVKNKGEGRIFLLHGSPGVGKTCTAECVAELTHRPLLSLTSGDISTSMSASSVESNLHYFLELGERFGALVLLDEADVYLEERRTRDLRRNGLVSIFLRALEYYRGVLFLTTNRVEAFDSAFTSRIHVALHYRRLNDDDRRRVWMHNFERLERDSGGRCYVPQSAREYAFESADMRALRWNGREIRNGLQTAVALAETEAAEGGIETVMVTDKQLRAVVKMSSGFREFLSKSRAGKKGRRRGDVDDDEDEEEDEDGDSNEEEEEEEEDEEEEEGSVSSAETEDYLRHRQSRWTGSGNDPPATPTPIPAGMTRPTSYHHHQQQKYHAQQPQRQQQQQEQTPQAQGAYPQVY